MGEPGTCEALGLIPHSTRREEAGFALNVPAAVAGFQAGTAPFLLLLVSCKDIHPSGGREAPARGQCQWGRVGSLGSDTGRLARLCHGQEQAGMRGDV